MMNMFKLPMLVAASIVLIVLAKPTSAQDTLTSCADISNADERLACYDRAVENSRDLPVVRLPRNAPPPPSPPAGDDNTQGNAAAPRQDEFGLELKQEKKQDSEPDARSYRVLAASHNDFTGWTIEFEGGGKWKQVGTYDYDIKVGEVYTVRRATFNSYLLSNSKNSRKIRITRVE